MNSSGNTTPVQRESPRREIGYAEYCYIFPTFQPPATNLSLGWRTHIGEEVTLPQKKKRNSTMASQEEKLQRICSLDPSVFRQLEEQIFLYIDTLCRKYDIDDRKKGKEPMEPKKRREQVIDEIHSKRKLSFLEFDKCEVRKSHVHGRGVFAVSPIREGEVFTLYPADVPAKSVGDNILYEIDADHPFFDTVDKVQDYTIEMGKTILVGDPTLVSDRSYIGHMINDLVMSGNFKAEAVYNGVSEKFSNASLKQVAEHFICVVASRDIAIDEEIFISYGLQYWRRSYQ